MKRPREREYHSEAGPFQNAFYPEASTFAENELEPVVVVHASVLSPQMVGVVISSPSTPAHESCSRHTALQDSCSEQDPD